MFDMLKTIVLDALGLKAAPDAPAAVRHAPVYFDPAPANALGAEPIGYPVYDSTDMLTVSDNRFGIL